MVPRQSIQEKYNEVRKKFCFYLDIQDNEVAGTLSKRIEDLGLVQEVFLTERVSHVVRDRESAAAAHAHPPRWTRTPEGGAGARSRADAMLQRVHTHPHSPPPAAAPLATAHLTITVQKAIVILDKIYDTFFSAPARWLANRVFKEPYIKIEFLDKLCRPAFKELEVWPDIALDPEPPRAKKTSANKPPDDGRAAGAGAKMTRKSRPRAKERDAVEAKAGYCEMCNADYADAAQHRRSPHHLAFVRDQSNFLALDSLIATGADVSSFLDKTAPLNVERRSLRIMCNGEPDQPQQRARRSNRSQSPAESAGDARSPRRANGGLSTRCGKRAADDRQYYKVVGVSTKLRSSGGFVARRRDSPPPVCNGAEPLVVKFRRVRRSELSVLSDEAEQFMFPKRASSASSSSDDDTEAAKPSPQARADPPPALERRRLARPLAFKEDSSSEDGWPEDKRKRRRRGPGAPKRGRPPAVKVTKAPSPQPEPEPEPPAPAEPEPPAQAVVPVPAESEAAPPPPPEQPAERCLKWEDGRLKYSAAVEQLEFAFERVPASEPWFHTFKRQDDHKVTTRNVPRYFALYARSAKLPYELGPLPPPKANCCALSDMEKRDEKPGPSRSYGTRGNKRQKVHKRTAAALLALDAHPRKSPREHASTLAILGSAGLLHRRRRADDAKSTASEDTLSETLSATRVEAASSTARQASERLRQFFSEVFDDAAEYDVSEDAMDGEPAITTSTGLTDVLHLVSEADACDTIRDEIRSEAAARTARRQHKVKKKNRTGWPNKKKARAADAKADRSSADCREESTQDESSEADEPAHACAESAPGAPDDRCEGAPDGAFKSEQKPVLSDDASEEVNVEAVSSDDKALRLDVKVLLRSEDKPKTEQEPKPEPEPDDKGGSRSSLSEGEEREREREPRTERRPGRGKKKRSSAANGVAYRLMQPVVRVARVDQNAARKLRSSASRSRANRLR